MTDIVLRLLMALLVGAAIGIERQIHHHEAGLRTNTLVALGSALYVSLGVAIGGDGGTGRVAAQVITGIGFLGGGVILRDGLHIRGLTTAATLWCTAAVGTLVGLGHFKEAIAGAIAVLTVNSVVKSLSLRLGEDSPPPVPAIRCRLAFSVSRDAEASVFASVNDRATAAGFHLTSYKTAGGAQFEFEAYRPGDSFESVLEFLQSDSRIESLEWQRLA